MGAKKSAFMSGVAGVLVGCMLTLMFMPQLMQKTSIGKELSSQGQNQVETTEVSPEKVTYVQNSTDNIYKAVAKKAMPSVVGVQTTSEVSDYFGFTYPATGVGTGQTNRIWATQHALEHAKGDLDSLEGAVLASDAFFPFRDCVDEAAKYGIKALVQPGGSIRDKESIEAADEHGMTMVFTGIRHFKH